MDEDGLPLMGSGIDLTKVPAIQQKRTVAFLNQFVVHTVQFLNRFSAVCEEDIEVLLIIQSLNKNLESSLNAVCLPDRELANLHGLCDQKLSNLSLRIQQIETTLNILDAKLSSIPGLDEVRFEVSTLSVTDDSRSETALEPSQQNSVRDSGPQANEVSAENIVTVAKDPRYARYLKMVQVGVPVMAIRNKMMSEGLDPDLLERPDAPVPEGESDKTAAESSDSESSFSD